MKLKSLFLKTNHIVGLLLYCFCFASVLAQEPAPETLERWLSTVKDLSYKKVSKPTEKNQSYLIKIKQPLDHKDTSKGHFYQSVVLTHHGFNQPTVMETQGYQLYLGKNELENLLNANHINIEHRFFGNSKPDTLLWSYLNLEQATEDLHHINQLFKQVYKNKWFSTGISKGGQTTIHYKYFYPNDVDVAIPYVAPFTEGLEDKRIYQFLDTIGSEDCRNKIKSFQTYLLKNETAALEKLKWYSKGAGYTFNYLNQSLAKAYEMAVLEYSFSFWQWGNDCNTIPVNVNLDSALNHLLIISSIDFFNDKSMQEYGPHYYQAATEMGYYGYNIEPFKSDIQQFKSNPLASFAPKEAGIINFNGDLHKKVNQWLNEKGNDIIYIYGGIDTWSANRVIPSSKVNSKSFLIPGKSHGNARIMNMPLEMKNEVSNLILKWTYHKLNFNTL
jgi:PS-10 peptidase S37